MFRGYYAQYYCQTILSTVSRLSRNSRQLVVSDINRSSGCFVSSSVSDLESNSPDSWFPAYSTQIKVIVLQYIGLLGILGEPKWLLHCQMELNFFINLHESSRFELSVWKLVRVLNFIFPAQIETLPYLVSKRVLTLETGSVLTPAYLKIANLNSAYQN